MPRAADRDPHLFRDLASPQVHVVPLHAHTGDHRTARSPLSTAPSRQRQLPEALARHPPPPFDLTPRLDRPNTNRGTLPNMPATLELAPHLIAASAHRDPPEALASTIATRPRPRPPHHSSIAPCASEPHDPLLLRSVVQIPIAILASSTRRPFLKRIRSAQALTDVPRRAQTAFSLYRRRPAGSLCADGSQIRRFVYSGLRTSGPTQVASWRRSGVPRPCPCGRPHDSDRSRPSTGRRRRQQSFSPKDSLMSGLPPTFRPDAHNAELRRSCARPRGRALL